MNAGLDLDTLFEIIVGASIGIVGLASLVGLFRDIGAEEKVRIELITLAGLGITFMVLFTFVVNFFFDDDRDVWSLSSGVAIFLIIAIVYRLGVQTENLRKSFLMPFGGLLGKVFKVSVKIKGTPFAKILLLTTWIALITQIVNVLHFRSLELYLVGYLFIFLAAGIQLWVLLIGVSASNAQD